MRGELNYMHTEQRIMHTHALWRASRLSLVACVYKALRTISTTVITVAGRREQITAAIIGPTRTNTHTHTHKYKSSLSVKDLLVFVNSDSDTYTFQGPSYSLYEAVIL